MGFIIHQKSNTTYGTHGSAHISVPTMASPHTVAVTSSPRALCSVSNNRELYARNIRHQLLSLARSDVAPVVASETFVRCIPDITRALVVAVRTLDQKLTHELFSLLRDVFDTRRVYGTKDSVRDIACWMVQACILTPFRDKTLVVVAGFRLLATLQGTHSIRVCFADVASRFPLESDAVLAGAVAFLSCSPDMDAEDDTIVARVCAVAALRWESKKYATLFVAWVLYTLRKRGAVKHDYITQVALYVGDRRQYEDTMREMTCEISRFLVLFQSSQK